MKITEKQILVLLKVAEWSLGDVNKVNNPFEHKVLNEILSQIYRQQSDEVNEVK